MKVFSNPDKEKVIKEASLALGSSLESNRDKPILFLSSGGSSFSLLSNIPQSNLGNNITISVLDERYSKDPSISNFSQLAKTEFFGNAVQRNCRFIDTRVRRGEELEQLADRFEQELREWKKSNPQGVVIVTQGIGEDGHTAGIMPYFENPELFRKLFENEEKWVVGYDARGKNPYPLRVTVTMPFLRKIADHAIVYMSGENKREALGKVLSRGGTLWEIPGRIIKEMRDVKLFTNILVY